MPEPLFNKVAGLRIATLLKRNSGTGVLLLAVFCKIFREEDYFANRHTHSHEHCFLSICVKTIIISIRNGGTPFCI